MESKRESSPARVALKVNKPMALILMGLWLLVFIGCIWFLVTALLWQTPTIWKKLVVSVAIFATTGAFFALVRSLGLVWVEGGALIFDEQGVRDRISFISLGFIPLRYVKSVRFMDIAIWRFLEIEIQPKAFDSSFAPKRFMIWLYQLLFGSSLKLPLALFEASSLDLEARLIHFQRIRQQSEKAKTTSTPEASFESKDMERREKDGKSAQEALQDLAETQVVASSSDLDETVVAPPLPPEEERSPSSDTLTSSHVLSRVASIRAFVKKLGLDQSISEFYWDFVRNFPYWAKNGDARLPASVTGPEKLSQTSEKEEFAFTYNESRYQFSLRKDIGPGRQALLSVQCGDETVMTLKVQLEIDTLEPVEIESFIDGSWRTDLHSLFKEIQLQREEELAKRLQFSDDEEGGDALTPGSKSEIVRLKKKFGLKD